MKKRVLSLLLALTMCLSLSIPAWAVVPPEDAFSEFAPYEEVNRAIGKTALSIIENAETRQYYEKHIKDMQLVLEEVTTKTTYIEEGIDGNGQLFSRVLNRKEVEQFKETRVAPSSRNVSSENTRNGIRQLTVTLSKSRDARGNYVLNGYAEWDTDPLTADGYTHPYPGDDYMGIRWGGNKKLEAISYSFSGWYTDGSRMTGYLEKADTYEGLCWAFNERTALFGKVMDHASIIVVLDSTSNQMSNQETGASLEYIHTFEEKTVSWHIDFNGTNFSGGFSLSNCANKWSLSAPVSGIEY